MANLPDDELPSKFDVIVDGTGLVQSILAAAVARVGKSVLHIDRNGFYGEHWASLMHRELRTWMSEVRNLSTPPESAPSSDEHTIAFNCPCPGPVSNLTELVPASSRVEETDTSSEQPIADISTQQSPPSDITNEQESPTDSVNEQGPPTDSVNEQGPPTDSTNEQESPTDSVNEQGLPTDSTSEQGLASGPPSLSWQSLEPQWRRFSFDLMPKVLYCRGALVELLTESNCGRYLEFKAVEKIYTVKEGGVDQVPCSRADVFSSQSVSMTEKRKMMKFLTFCADYTSQPEQFEEFVDVPFGEFLKLKDLPDNLVNYIVHSIAMVDRDTPTLTGLQATKVFLTSLGRFGNAPFLYPVFGVGELGQAFCRLCAVFGGVYCLRRSIERLVVSDNSLTGVICSTGQKIDTSAVVCSAGRVRSSVDIGESVREKTVSRAIVVTDGPLSGTDGKVTVLSVPPLSTGSAQSCSVFVIQLDPLSNCSAPGTYLLHFVCPSAGSTAQSDLEPVVRAFLDMGTESEGSGPHVLWVLFFNLTLYLVNGEVTPSLPTGVHLTSDPDTTMAYEGAVKEARRIFEQLCPGEDFLPTPPDPSDIIYDSPPSGEDNNGQAPAVNEVWTDDREVPGNAADGDSD